jgi:copper(I)-binding protein
MKRVVVPVLMLALAGAASAHAWPGDLTIKDPVMRAVAPGVANTAGYLTIVNAGAKPDRLLSVSCACANSVEVHQSQVMNGMAMMMASGPVAIPAHGQLSFSPGGYHLMVTGLKTPLKDGGSEAVTLRFEHAGTVTVDFAVRARIGG